MPEENKSNFNLAMDRILRAKIDTYSLIQLFKGLKDASDTAETEQSALTLGFSDDRDVHAGDYIPTLTLSVTKVSDELAKILEEKVKNQESTD